MGSGWARRAGANWATLCCLLIGVGIGGAALGTANGWLAACCTFPGRRWLRIAQLLPLATPGLSAGGHPD